MEGDEEVVDDEGDSEWLLIHEYSYLWLTFFWS